MNRPIFVTLILALTHLSTAAFADVRLPRIFTDHMVLQREMPVNVWGWADPGEKITVEIAGQSHSATADADGKWRVTLQPLAVGEPLKLVVKGNNQVEVNDILVGEVWVCSGQSNMEWPVSHSDNADLTRAAANTPQIRFLQVKAVGTQTPNTDIEQRWVVCTPDSVNGFSAVGYFFGRQLHQTLGVPIGLIDNSWGGSSCETWVPREKFEGEALYEPLLARWKQTESEHDEAKLRGDYDAQLAEWRTARDAAEARGEAVPAQPGINNPLFAQHRPANLYNARVAPLLPFAIRGAIWYQGESNADRAYQYRDLFPRMIASWRDAWGQGDFPFYWVQLADFMPEKPEPAESPWAELREAQTMTLDRLPKTGQAVIIDIGDGKDIHPRNKEEVGKRLARLALANDYGVAISDASPRYDHFEVNENKAIVTFRHFGEGLMDLDVPEIRGFTLAGKDRKWHVAQAKVISPSHQVEVTCDAVPEPVAVRYAWADNPVVNLYSSSGLPVTPFRTDDWPSVTANNK
ncbi:MAG: sialate O-acetylesterase [Pirellulales bacterium]